MRTPLFVAALAALSFQASLAVAQQPTPPAAPTPPATPAAPAVPEPRYLGAIRTELRAMGIEATCEAESDVRARCSYAQRGPQSTAEFRVELLYNDENDVAYLYVRDFGRAPADAASTPQVLRRLMELNWELMIGKFEWNPSDGEVRLSTVLNTDSNFDRRAFRSLVRAMLVIADRFHVELTRLTGAR